MSIQNNLKDNITRSKSIQLTDQFVKMATIRLELAV